LVALIILFHYKTWELISDIFEIRGAVRYSNLWAFTRQSCKSWRSMITGFVEEERGFFGFNGSWLLWHRHPACEQYSFILASFLVAVKYF